MNKRPEWYEEFVEKFQAGTSHMFLFHFNVSDFALLVPEKHRWLTVKHLLVESLKSFKIVVTYNRSSGITFPSPEMETAFRKLMGEKAGPPKPLPASPLEALPLLEKVLQISVEKARELLGKEMEGKDKVVAVIIGFAETIAPSGNLPSQSSEDRTNIVTLARWARHQDIEKSGNMVMMLTKNLADVTQNLRAASSRVESIRIPLPSLQERAEFIEWLITEEMKNLKFDNLDINSMAAMTAGLSRTNLLDIAKRANFNGNKLSAGYIWELKKKILEDTSGGLIEVIRPRWGFEAVGGLETVKQFLRKTARAIASGDRLRVPMGVLFLGPPGTGKTVSAEALAKEIGFCFIKLKNIREMWVGQSERNQSFCFELIRALAPCIVFVDEIDQQMQSRGSGFSGDSGVSERLLADQLAFMSDTALRGKIVWIAATNRPDLIDPAMRREGRFDVKLPFMPPEKEDLPKIFQALFTKLVSFAGDHNCKLEFEISDEELAELCGKMEGYIGSEIEFICNCAYDFAAERRTNGCVKININDLEAARQDFITSRDQDAYDYMTFLALKETNLRSLLPAKYRGLTQEEIIAKLREKRPLVKDEVKKPDV